MTKKICPQPGCPTITDGGRCAEHRRDRGTTTQQGLGWQHQQNRARLIRAAIGTLCPDCGEPMTDPNLMVADHSTQDRRRPADRVHCRRCSDRQGGRLAHA